MPRIRRTAGYRAVIAVMDAAAAMANELASDDGGGGGVSVGPFTLGEDATVRLRVASSAEDRVGFFTNASRAGRSSRSFSSRSSRSPSSGRC